MTREACCLLRRKCVQTLKNQLTRSRNAHRTSFTRRA